MIRIHREGMTIVSGISIMIAMIVIVSAYFFSPWLFIATLVILTTILVLVFRFFRIPRRIMKIERGAVMAPADGKVVAIEKVREDEYFKDDRIQVSIFMSIHNVHINWFPIGGNIAYFKYHPGKYLLARHPKSSALNERTSVVISNEQTEILVRQIAGYVARRIICYANPGKTVEQSTEMGFIRFGSRLDVFLPADANILVELGDTTTGGVTSIARIGN
ncbi:MAG: phosphatidylserine decarboxylase family protein [Bacteroidales bacterium]|nr:phosphatidylserine decarboxylase family protein [Bacteroidales bacterium]MDT8431079.1 phosphatidylserine decarboxylase family protein [Bacteroidales bacterium]